MTTNDIHDKLANELNLQPRQVTNAVELLDGGNTIPFIARYRKEMTGALDEEQLRQLEARLAYLRHLAERKETVIKTIMEQGKLTPELHAAITAAETLQEVEDLYLPYKPKRRTRATIARERGLQPLADLILEQIVKPGALDELAAEYLSDEVPTVADAWAGARDIVAETVAENAEVRKGIRELFRKKSAARVAVGDEAADEKGVYEIYYDFAQPITELKPHQILAINRGEEEKVLKVNLDVPEDEVAARVRAIYRPNRKSPLAAQLREASDDAYTRLIRPSIEREIRRGLTEAADEHAIKVFATNLRNLLLTPPLRGRTILALDPGYRTGCKVAVISPTGAVRETGTIYPHEPQKRWEKAKSVLGKLIARRGVNLIVIGNGTASRETEQLAAELVTECETSEGAPLQYLVVSEAGASVYSAMPLAREELPDLDVSIRGAVSIGRRVLDPLAELVKIDPKSIGVGLYQHDVDQKQLAASLDAVVESAVNHVGVNLNTASPTLLRYIAGLGPKTAAAVVSYRDEQGAFRRRAELRKVKGIGPKAFEQAAGFLRIPDGDEPLDNTGVHPESYEVVARLLAEVENVKGVRRDDVPKLARKLDVGEPTLADIVRELEKPGRDPRDELPAPILRSDVLSMDDLREGMRLKGTVRNVVDFGAFVDIGVKQDGLVHVSQMAHHYVRDPHAEVAVGDVVDVTVLSVDAARGRIGLSMK